MSLLIHISFLISAGFAETVDYAQLTVKIPTKPTVFEFEYQASIGQDRQGLCRVKTI